MKRYLPNTQELRQAIFTAIAIIVLAVIIGTIGSSLRHAFWSERFDDGFTFRAHDSRMDDMSDTDMPPTDGTASMQDMMKDMNANLVGLKGDALDREFLKEMIAHHQGAVDMAKVLQAGTKRPELQKMAADIINVQTKEINMMQNWLDTWFPENK